jgi:DNA-directed RNA polymerase specialized sigma24 family protein
MAAQGKGNAVTETTPAYLATPSDAPSDARDWLKAQLKSGVPEYPDPLRSFLDALSWRQRSIVVLLFAESMTQERVGWLMGVSHDTVQRDLKDVCRLLLGGPIQK